MTRAELNAPTALLRGHGTVPHSVGRALQTILAYPTFASPLGNAGAAS